ncbi:MAG: hypothetical protein M1826_003804 [Phylliscum demangeonii]|nr:MAG: hypothetical protein M1826_003804 [Phylliscum demangeonii]
MSIHVEEGPLSAEAYNRLPLIATMQEAAVTQRYALKTLLAIIHTHQLERGFSETIRGSHHPDFFLSSPRIPGRCQRIHGHYFMASGPQHMSAYEYTMDPTTSLSSYPSFPNAFHAALLRLEVADVFALTAKAPETKRMTEIEMADIKATIIATVLVTAPSGLLSNEDLSTNTDWIATDALVDEGLPGIVQPKCTETRSLSHYNFACSKTRAGSHYESKSVGSANPKDDPQLFLSDERLPSDGEAHAIVRRARDLVAAT